MNKHVLKSFMALGFLVFFVCQQNVAVASSITALDSIDNTIYYNSGDSAHTDTLSNGKGVAFVAGHVATTGYIRRALVQFSMPALPSGAVIDSVTLQLYAIKNAQNNTASRSFSLYKVTQAWGEGSSTASAAGTGTGAKTGDATWLRTFFNTVSWTNAGGDFSSTVSGTCTAFTTASRFVSFRSGRAGQMKQDVQSWYVTPGSNHGWILRGAESVLLSATEFASFQTTLGSSYKPTLTIYYH
jgi:hypothetical protein